MTQIKRMSKMIHEDLSRIVIGVAMEVLNELKPGLDEKLYERAMIIEVRRNRPCRWSTAFRVSLARRAYN